MDIKAFPLTLKSLDESGTFTGKLAVYGNVDEVGDCIEPHAFDKSISEAGSSIPLLFAHDQSAPIGTLELTDTPGALLAKGKLVLTVARAREVYDLLKAGAVRGLSIGYKAIKSAAGANGVRLLKEIRLFEGSLCAVPANPAAVVTGVKQVMPGPDPELVRQAVRDIRNFHRQVIDGN